MHGLWIGWMEEKSFAISTSLVMAGLQIAWWLPEGFKFRWLDMKAFPATH